MRTVLSLTSQRWESPRTWCHKGLKLRDFCRVGVGVGDRAGAAATIGHLRTGSGGNRWGGRWGQRNSSGRGSLLVGHGADCRSGDVSGEKKSSFWTCNFASSCIFVFHMITFGNVWRRWSSPSAHQMRIFFASFLLAAFKGVSACCITAWEEKPAVRWLVVKDQQGTESLQTLMDIL